MRKRTRLDSTLPTFTVDGKVASPSISASNGIVTFGFLAADGWRAGMTKRVCVTIHKGECFVFFVVCLSGRAAVRSTLEICAHTKLAPPKKPTPKQNRRGVLDAARALQERQHLQLHAAGLDEERRHKAVLRLIGHDAVGRQLVPRAVQKRRDHWHHHRLDRAPGARARHGLW